MKYLRYKMHFLTGVHFGKNSLDEGKAVFSADTLFSAIFQEAMKKDVNFAEQMLQWCKNGNLLFSDAFPYIEEECYLPKPCIRNEKRYDFKTERTMRKLSFLPDSKIQVYLKGNIDAESELRKWNTLGEFSLQTKVGIHGFEKTEPYHVGIFYFGRKNGLYIIVAVSDELVEKAMDEMLISLSFTGIGGKRTSGLGRFAFEKEELEGEPFEREGKTYLLLTSSVPESDELEKVLEHASYQLVKRSGFIQSENYAEEQRKKKDIFFFTSGACFEKKFAGDVYDVSNGGSHAVYRYGKPLFLTI